MSEPNYAAADSSLEISSESRDGAMLVHFDGGFSLINHLLLERALQEIKATSQRKIVLDLSNIRYIDSMGVGVIISVLKHSRTNAISFAIVTNDVVNQILGVTNLIAIMQVARSVDEAIAKATP